MGDATCSIEGCVKNAKNRGWCSAHYERWRRHGNPNQCQGIVPLWDRFWPKVDATGDCWEWVAAKNHVGYGQIGTVGRKRGMAHRVAWELLVGPIPPGYEIDHLCRNHGCVNPDHLEPVPPIENKRRAPWSAPLLRRTTTHCPAGHAYAGDNLYLNPKGRRECRACRKARR